ncbi:hypothetical protein [Vibrio cincinnatiensis]|uniref:hypothetical protein n=1 Tax=Vibrio cincinnatiensis TaxID=675 RepID=UPI001EDE30E0|nr:hypothetical protein [Vibrio cincinnatiensis]
MSLSILGVFLVGFFGFLMGRDYNPATFKFTFSDIGHAMLEVWALVGVMTFLCNWATVG